MKKSILVLYFSQSGQLRDILDNILADIKGKVDITYAPIEPVTPFPWPWKTGSFFDAMPETVERIPVDIKPIPEAVKEKDYDLVLFGFQPWFLHPSQPITGFLRSEQAHFLKGRNIVTVIGCRNMWLNAQENVKEDLQNIGASLSGNLVFQDTHPNLVSLFTIIRWAFKGQKEASGILPVAGVQEDDIKAASRFGNILFDFLYGKNNELQSRLLELKAVQLNPGLILLEQRGIKNFRFWAKYIREKGGPGSPARKGRVLLFQRLLMTAIFILSPISSFTAFIQLQLKKKKLVKDVDYFQGTAYRPGKI